MNNITIKYTGKYPHLCMGALTVIIDGNRYKFPSNCLTSGGSVYFTNNYLEEHVKKGPWEVTKWPNNFPEEYKQAVLKKINETIPWGCCGGCL